MNEFFTLSTLGTMAGATTAVTLVTQFIKWLTNDKLHGWITRAVSFGVALLALFVVALATNGGMDVPTAIVTVLNAIIVTLASNGLFDGVKSVTDK